MATLLETLLVKLAADATDYDKTLKGAQSSLDGFSEKAKAIGGTLTKDVSLPLAALGGVALKVSTDFNAGLANIQSLGVAQDRVLALKTGIQDLAVTVGKSTDDIVGGTYEVISTWGDSADTLDLVNINARAAAAGLSTTEEAIGLTSAVTKGYGDTSKEATQHAADLAFQTVNLGQTTFPELAASIGKVVPIAASLGVTQEELFAQMATLTGVTGDAAEVTTQLRALYTSILKPTEDMSGALAKVATDLDSQGKLVGGPLVDAWRSAENMYQQDLTTLSQMENALAGVDTSTKAGEKAAKDLNDRIDDQKKALGLDEKAINTSAAALGQSIVQSVGLTDATNMLSATANGNTDTMGKMFGSVEAVTAVLALSGGQADSFKDKLAAMQDVTGAVDKAFQAQTEGVNKNGFTMAQAAVKAQVLLEKLGDGLAPAIGKVLDIATPWVDKLVAMADWFANADSSTQTWIVSIVALVAAAGPVIGIIGTIVSIVSGAAGLVGAITGAASAVGALGVAFTVLTGPIGIVVAAIAALALAWSTDFLGIRSDTEAVIGWIGNAWPGFVDGLQSKWQSFTGWLEQNDQRTTSAIQGYWQSFTGWLSQQTQGTLSTVQGYFENHSQSVQGIAQNQWSSVQTVVQMHLDAIRGIAQAGVQFMQGDWQGGLQTLQSTAEGLWSSLQSIFQNQLDSIRNLFEFFGWGDIGDGIIQGIADGVSNGVGAIEDAARDAAQAALDAAKSWLGIGSPSKVAAAQLGEPFTEGVGVGAVQALPSVTDRIQGALDSMIGGLSLPEPAMAGQRVGGAGGLQINVYLNGSATYDDGRRAGQGIADELRARGLA